MAELDRREAHERALFAKAMGLTARDYDRADAVARAAGAYGLAVLDVVSEHPGIDQAQADAILGPLTERIDESVRREHGQEADAIIRDAWLLVKHMHQLVKGRAGDDDGK